MRLSVLLERTFRTQNHAKVQKKFHICKFCCYFFDKCNIKHAHLCASTWCFADDILTERDSKIDFLAKMLAYIKKKSYLCSRFPNYEINCVGGIAQLVRAHDS